MIKEKKCKGQGKANGFESCGDVVPVEQRKYGLCKSCLAKWIVETKEGDEFLQKTLVRNKKKIEKKLKQQRKEEKEALIDYKPKLQQKINEIVRIIDLGQPCLALGYHPNQTHAGHVYARGGNSSIALNLHNIHRQSAQSNHSHNDDGKLREGVVNEYGIEYMDFISGLRRTPKLEYMNHEYKSFYKHASMIALELKKQGRTFPTTDERIFMRNEINNLLGIYDQEYCEFKI